VVLKGNQKNVLFGQKMFSYFDGYYLIIDSAIFIVSRGEAVEIIS
jgi:hypothetical protein